MVLFSGSLKIKCMHVLCQTLCSIIKSKKGFQLEYIVVKSPSILIKHMVK